MTQLTLEIGSHLYGAVYVIAAVVVLLGWFRFKAGGRKIL